jgi:hypothetical protein
MYFKTHHSNPLWEILSGALGSLKHFRSEGKVQLLFDFFSQGTTFYVVFTFQSLHNGFFVRGGIQNADCFLMILLINESVQENLQNFSYQR